MLYKVVLEHVGDQVVRTIKEVREAAGCGLKEAKDLVDHAPQTVMSNLTMERAEALALVLENLGNRVSIQGDAGAPVSMSLSGTYQVVLERVGSEVIRTIKEVREMTGYGLKEAKDLVDHAPQTVKTNLTREKAEEIKRILESVGNRVSVVNMSNLSDASAYNDMERELMQPVSFGATQTKRCPKCGSTNLLDGPCGLLDKLKAMFGGSTYNQKCGDCGCKIL